jgi:predicted nucleic acid-binding protein
LSRIRVEPVTKESATRSAGLLKEARLRGHKYATDAMVAEVALRLPGPVVVLTSDVDAMSKLCGRRVRIVGL